MNPYAILLAPLAVLVPTLAAAPVAPDADDRTEATAVASSEAFDAVRPAEDPIAAQVRIERRITIRIAPPGPVVRQGFVADIAPAAAPRFSERKIGKCVPVAGIAAVQPDGGKLLLFMRDRRLVSATLEKACSARDFYAGFYLERAKDGMLCANRDRLHSRSGANCEVSRIRQLVAKDD